MTGCSEKQQVYVKDVYLSKDESFYKLSVKYYDFLQQNEEYLTSEYVSEDPYQTGIKAMDDKNYSFRLCKNIYIHPEIFINDINTIIYVINSLKVSPNANLLCYAGDRMPENLTADRLSDNPLYNISIEDNGVTGCFPVISDASKGHILVKSGKSIIYLDKNKRLVLGVITNYIKDLEYSFRQQQMWAYINDICTRFYIENDILNICIDGKLKDYKGINNSIQSKTLFTELLETDISNMVYEIYNDTGINSVYNLHWFCMQTGKECKDIKVNINIK